MAQLQLFIKEVRVADWDLQLPSYRIASTGIAGLSKEEAFQVKCTNRQMFIEEKTKLMMLNHLRLILKYPEDWRIELIIESKI